MIGTTIGNYVVQGKIGEGGMGVVYVAEHPKIGRKVAIKVLLPEYSQNEEVVSRFFTEARASSAIKNEHIIDIIDFGELADKSSYIIMEWLEGEPLSRTLDREGMLSVDRALHVTKGIGQALAAAHARGIVHRDLKPDNVFLVVRGDDNDFVKVLDFGIAKLLGNEATGSMPPPATASKTRTGAIIGTPTYMSPEQCRGVAVDARSDIYSLAVILYQMLVGRVPFEAEGLGDLLLKHMTEPPRPPRELSPAIPEHVERAVLRALEKDPAQRYALVTDFLRDLGAPISTSSVRAVPSEAAIKPQSATRAAVVGSIDTIGGASGEAVPAPRSRARVAAWMIALPAAAVVAAVAVFVLRPTDRGSEIDVHKAEGLPVATPVTPAARPTPSPTAPPAPAVVRFAVRTTPPTAKLQIDGVEHTSPYDVELPADGRLYDVLASAPGFAPYHASVKLDRPQDIEVVLDPDKDQHHHGDTRHAHALPAPPPGTTPDATLKAPTPNTTATKTGTKKDDRTYQGTKGTLITDFPESN